MRLRLVKVLAAPAVAAVLLTGCTSTVSGTAAPPGSVSGQGSGSDLDPDAAIAALLTLSDLPSTGYEQLPDVDAEDLLGMGTDEPGPDTSVIDPPECSEAFATVSGDTMEEMYAGAVLRGFAKFDDPTSISMIAELIMPPDTAAGLLPSFDIPPGCETITVSDGSDTITMTMTQLPVDIGSESRGIRAEATSSIEGYSIELVMSMILVVEENGGLAIVAGNEDAVIEIAQIAYDKAESVLK